ncbi:MAG: rhomboid family intramembrane serine protease [Oscillospiraceae bacterium]|nr:rhomboid family intramembrane serine protease [Oscillospiraceae bacterium]
MKEHDDDKITDIKKGKRAQKKLERPQKKAMKKSLSDRLERKLGRFAVRNLMSLIVYGMALVFVADLALSFSEEITFDLTGILMFARAEVLHGQVWRLFSFIFIPPESSIIFIIFALYLYWMMGSALEREWGRFKFNVFYLFGVIGTIISGFIAGFATSHYLNMSIFFAFAILFPNFELRLFFILPIKIKYLAWLNAAYFLFALIFNPLMHKLAVAAALLNIALFFGKDFIRSIKNVYRRAKWRRDTKKKKD